MRENAVVVPEERAIGAGGDSAAGCGKIIRMETIAWYVQGRPYRSNRVLLAFFGNTHGIQP